MNREEILKDVLSLKERNICLELSTGVGKTKIALEILQKREARDILIVIPRLALINNWKEEINKWGFTFNPLFTTYISFPKHTGRYDAVIYDEAHHLTDRCLEAIPDITSKNNLFLSATLKKEHKYRLKECFPKIRFYKVNTQQAIDNEILPEPKIVLIPLQLNKGDFSHPLVIHKNGKKTVETSYRERWRYMRNRDIKLIINCSEWQYNDYLSSTIDYYKRKYMTGRNEIIKNKWLRLCNDRLLFLSSCKNNAVLNILKKLENERVITFCSTIEQTKILGENAITSDNKDSLKLIEDFNRGKINHITAVNILNEGCNLADCKYGIFAAINSSEIMQIQKVGRLLRHPHPVLIIPYFAGTREQEIVKKMLENYNQDYVIKTNNF